MWRVSSYGFLIQVLFEARFYVGFQVGYRRDSAPKLRGPRIVLVG